MAPEFPSTKFPDLLSHNKKGTKKYIITLEHSEFDLISIKQEETSVPGANPPSVTHLETSVPSISYIISVMIQLSG